jgi:2-methylcitrate dehydratase PrpD
VNLEQTTAAQLAAFATAPAAVPEGVLDRARLHLLDVLGCGLAAVGLGQGAAASAVLHDEGGAPQASVLGERERTAAAPAALASGTRCHALDFDDTHEAGICHSSAVVAPAAIALAEAGGRPTEELLDAFVLGSEVALRIAVAAADGLYARGFHPTSVCGVFGAAAAAARLLGLQTEQATNALGVVGSFAGGLLEYLSDGSATKPLHAGWAAQAGIQAARLAGAGATGPASVIDGRFGLLRAYADGGPAESISTALGERWEIARLSIKPFPACHFAHSSTWAAAELVERNELDPCDIEAIYVRIPPEGEPLVLDPLADKLRPRTTYDAKFSLPFMVAHRVLHGGLELTSFSRQAIRDKKTLELAARVRPEPFGADPPSRFAGGARIVTTDGREVDLLVEHAPGSPENPLDADWVATKFDANASLALEPGDAEALKAAVLAGAGPLEGICEPMRRAGRRA